MDQVCPLCNGLTALDATCGKCGARMIDDGMLTDYVGPYSPYELSPRMRVEEEGRCTHLLHCSSCANRSYAIIHQDAF
jgi:hypothetical protein